MGCWFRRIGWTRSHRNQSYCETCLTEIGHETAQMAILIFVVFDFLEANGVYEMVPWRVAYVLRGGTDSVGGSAKLQVESGFDTGKLVGIL